MARKLSLTSLKEDVKSLLSKISTKKKSTTSKKSTTTKKKSKKGKKGKKQTGG
jgi:hypothetical protein